LTAAFGVFLIVFPLATAKVTTVLLGWVRIFVGMAQLVFALHSQKAGGFLLKLLAAISWNHRSRVGVPAALATVAAFQVRRLLGWGWVQLDTATSLVLGSVDYRQVAVQLCLGDRNAAWCISVDGGIVRIVVAAKIRSNASGVERSLRAAA
jgi:uncharacterized membrane protein HdeD (DUF308 family)